MDKVIIKQDFVMIKYDPNTKIVMVIPTRSGSNEKTIKKIK